MNRLIPGIYGTAYAPKQGLFGLQCGQQRKHKILAENALWHNGKGQFLGWGSLTYHDIILVCCGLNCGELFIVTEKDKVDFYNAFQPGLGYIAENCSYVIAPLSINISSERDLLGKNCGCLALNAISRQEIKFMITETFLNSLLKKLPPGIKIQLFKLFSLLPS